MCIFFRRQLLKSDYTVWTSNLNEKGKTSPDVEKKQLAKVAKTSQEPPNWKKECKDKRQSSVNNKYAKKKDKHGPVQISNTTKSWHRPKLCGKHISYLMYLTGKRKLWLTLNQWFSGIKVAFGNNWVKWKIQLFSINSQNEQNNLRQLLFCGIVARELCRWKFLNNFKTATKTTTQRTWIKSNNGIIWIQIKVNDTMGQFILSIFVSND